MGSSARPRMVRRQIWHCDRTTGAGLAAHSGRKEHAYLCADGFRQDSRGLPGLHRSPGTQGACGRTRRKNRSLVCLTLESARQRHSKKPRYPVRRNSAARSRARIPDAGDTHRGANRRHLDARTPRDAEATAAYSRHDAGISLYFADRRKKPRNAAHREHCDRRRNSRRGRRQTRIASRAFTRAARCFNRTPLHAHRAFRHAEADRSHRAISCRKRSAGTLDCGSSAEAQIRHCGGSPFE